MFALTLGLLLLAPLAIAGVALLNTGLGRSRSAAQSLLGCLTLVAVSAIAFAVVGVSLAGAPGHTLSRRRQIVGLDRRRAAAAAAFQRPRSPRRNSRCCSNFWPSAWWPSFPGARARTACGSRLVALPRRSSPAASSRSSRTGSGADGWLARLGADFGLGAGFLDGAGAASVHAVGGLSALAVVWIAGPRRGKFPKEGLATAMPGHNAVYILFGCLLALGGLAGMERGGRDSLAARRAGRAGGYGHQHGACAAGRPGGHLHA